MRHTSLLFSCVEIGWTVPLVPVSYTSPIISIWHDVIMLALRKVSYIFCISVDNVFASVETLTWTEVMLGRCYP
ncbi:hypothetical protein PRUPE_3G057900 [Prunus persica]|uniref:Uncharacterized protein n=1 Tax=Prunus persica TaxID=3760 RepID=M5X4G9_PRUPE|nr:hypothetical protein PRUPE_3G057900 [Prunus persica]